MKKFCMCLSMFVVFALVSFLLFPINTKADENDKIDIDQDWYAPDEFGNKIFVIEPGNYFDGLFHYDFVDDQPTSSAKIENIIIPSDCCFIVDGCDNDLDFSFIGSITIEENGRLEVWTHGKNVSISKTGDGIVTVANDACVVTDSFQQSGVSFITGNIDTIKQFNGVSSANLDEIDNFNIKYNSAENHWWIDNFPFGDPAITDEVKNRIYGYSSDDVLALHDMLAFELYDRYVSDTHFYGFHYDCFDTFRECIEYAPVNTSTINVLLNDDTPDTREVYTFRVHWGFPRGFDENGEEFPIWDQGEIVSDVSVVSLYDNEIIVCTDFNNESGSGSKYYVKTIHDDTVVFAEGSGTQNEENFEEYLITDDSYSNIVIGGNYLDTYLITEDGLVSISFYHFDEEHPENGFSGILRVINPSNTYVAVIQEGETNKYGGLGINGLATENVFRTGDDAVAITYIGNTTIHVRPLSADLSLNTRLITNVELADSTQKDGVNIDKSNLNDVKVTFKSNFYDSVKLIITYEGGITKTLTIQRVGLVIQYMYLYEDGTSDLIMDHFDNGGKHLSLSYDYNSGEQVIIIATYYHPTNYSTKSGSDNLFLNVTYEDGTSKIINHVDSAHNFNGYLAPEAGSVASTTFIIGFTNAGQTNIQLKPFYATVMNAGFNDTSSYGGTQIGSGKGVYWDGHIVWNY